MDIRFTQNPLKATMIYHLLPSLGNRMLFKPYAKSVTFDSKINTNIMKKETMETKVSFYPPYFSLTNEVYCLLVNLLLHKISISR